MIASCALRRTSSSWSIARCRSPTAARRGRACVVGAREVREGAARPLAIDPAEWAPVAPQPLPEDGVATLAHALAAARRPLVVTSYLGRRPDAVDALRRLCRRL